MYAAFNVVYVKCVMLDWYFDMNNGNLIDECIVQPLGIYFCKTVDIL